ncbi:hypothetical protein [Tenacibaculum piscium]|uniref:hypothetical protein n=1 Tax=Tenacibaculum piscium TaxID=1458515 RepID=UPI001F3B4FD0|nr:hypothetical protein [Tenacibaculum piscium]
MMRKTNSFKLAVVAVGMLAIGTVSAQTTDLDVTAVDNKGTIKTLKVGNGITSEFDATDNSTTYSIGGTLTAPATITATTTNYFAVAGLNEASIANGDLPATDFNNPGLTLMVRDETTGEVKKLLASDAAKYLSAFNAAAYGEGNSTTISVPGLPEINPASAVDALTTLDFNNKKSRLFVYKNGVKLVFTTDFTVNTAGQVDLLVPVIPANDFIEVQFTN